MNTSLTQIDGSSTGQHDKAQAPLRYNLPQSSGHGAPKPQKMAMAKRLQKQNFVKAKAADGSDVVAADKASARASVDPGQAMPHINLHKRQNQGGQKSMLPSSFSGQNVSTSLNPIPQS